MATSRDVDIQEQVKSILTDCIELGDARIGPLEVWLNKSAFEYRCIISYHKDVDGKDTELYVLNAKCGYRPKDVPHVKLFRPGVWLNVLTTHIEHVRAERYEKYFSPIDDQEFWDE